MKERHRRLICKMGIAALALAAWPQLGMCDPATSSTSQTPTKLTSAEKKLDKAKAVESDKYVDQQAKAINKIPGANVDPNDLKESEVHKKSGGFPNPIGWMLKPVTRLQEQSVKLEQEIMKLTGPIGSLQPSMLKLDKSMSAVQTQMGSMQTDIKQVSSQMGSMQADIRAMRTDLSDLKSPIAQLKQPVMELRDPVLALAKPVVGVEGRLVRLDAQLNDLKTLLTCVLTAIFAAAAIVAVGTPVAAILVWRNRQKFVPATKPEEIHEEQKLAAAGSMMGREIDGPAKR